MLLSIILLNFKKPSLTINCVNSLLDVFKKELDEHKIEVIIVDNGSNDGSVKLMQERIEKINSDEISLIENKVNDGFAKGCNIGAANSKGKYLLFLNNDTIVKDKGIARMVDFLESHSDVAILGGQLRNIDGSLQASAGSFYTLSNAILLLLGFQRFGVLDKSPNTVSEVDWVKGAILMIKKEIFAKLNGFDEKIFMYTEDMELCYRAKKMGYKIYFYPDTLILHKEYASTNRTFAIVNIYKNLLYFYKKHRSYLEYLILYHIMKFKAILLIILGTFLADNYLKTTYKEALKTIK